MNTNKKILVTGATGFIGSNLVHRLVERGDTVAVLVRPTSNLAALADVLDKIEVRHGDVTNYDSILSATKGIDQVYHTAGKVWISAGRTDSLHRVNVEGTQNVVNACLANGVKRLVYTSSVSAIGITGKPTPATENQPWNLDKLDVAYFESKHLAEQEILRGVEIGLNAVIVNPGYVYGPRDVNFNAGGMIRDLYLGKIPAYPTGGLCVADVDDVVEAHLAAMEKGRCGERYILGGENLNYKAIFDTICGVTSAPKVIIPLTKTLLYVYEKLTGVARKAGRITPMANPKILATSQEFFYFDSAKARTELGLKQTPFEQTVQKAFTWYKQNGLL